MQKYKFKLQGTFCYKATAKFFNVFNGQYSLPYMLSYMLFPCLEQF